MSTRELRFTLTEDHIKLLRRAYVSWEDCEFGAPAIDCKRPYGNSSVECDVAEILGWKVDEEDGPNGEQRAAAEAIHRQTQTALQIVLVTGAMQAGEYVKTQEYDWRSWVRVDAAPSLPVVREEDIAYLRKTLESWNTSTATIAMRDIEAAARGPLDEDTRARFARMVATRDQIERIFSVLEALAAHQNNEGRTTRQAPPSEQEKR